MHENGYSRSDLEPGYVKQPGTVGDFWQLKSPVVSWQPTPADRALRVDVERAG